MVSGEDPFSLLAQGLIALLCLFLLALVLLLAPSSGSGTDWDAVCSERGHGEARKVIEDLRYAICDDGTPLYERSVR